MTGNSAPELLIVNFHYVRDSSQYKYPGIHPIEWDTFNEKVCWLKDRYHMATPGEVEAFAYGKNSLPGRSIFLTFDDGLIEHSALAKEILNPLNIKGAFFISSRPLLEGCSSMVQKIHWLRATSSPTDFKEQFLEALPDSFGYSEMSDDIVDKANRTYIYDTPENAKLKYFINFMLPSEVVDSTTSRMLEARDIPESSFCEDMYMDRSQLKGLVDDGHIIGSHGHSHMPFSQLPAAGLEEELQTNISFLEKIIGRKPHWISYPYGTAWSITEDTEALCKGLGFTMGLSLDKDIMGWNTGIESPLYLKRINVNEIEIMCR